jgi:hypothetical protein
MDASAVRLSPWRIERVACILGLTLLMVGLGVGLNQEHFFLPSTVVDVGRVADDRKLTIGLPVVVTRLGVHELVPAMSGACCARPRAVERGGPGLLRVRVVVDPSTKVPGAVEERVPITIRTGEARTTKFATIRYLVARGER